MTVREVTDQGIACEWFEGAKLRSRTFPPEMLQDSSAKPSEIKVSFVKPTKEEE